MKSILEELWYGNICPNDGYYKATKEVKDLTGCTASHHDNLYKTLTDTQKEILERFDDCTAKLNDIHEREIFVYAFQLGAKIAIEIMRFGTGGEGEI